MRNIHLIILAAGKGERMNHSLIPKVLIKLNNESLIEHLLSTINKTKYSKSISIIVGFKGQQVIDKLKNKYQFIWQKERLGTGHAIQQCKKVLQGKYDDYLILYGDVPFISSKTIKDIIDLHYEKKSIFTMVTLKLPDFKGNNNTYWHFGRIIRDDKSKIIKIIEFKDTTEEEKKVTEVNPALYCIKDNWIWDNLEDIKNNNNQKEYYLTDLVDLAHKQGIEINSFIIKNGFELIGVNTFKELELAKQLYLNKKL